MRPKRADAIKARPWSPETETIRCKPKGFGFYDAIENFERTFSGAVFLVGLRAAGESPNRWRAVVKNPVEIGGRRVFWGTKKGANITAYPIFDWNVHDVWRYIHDEQLPYSKVYDWQFRKGYPVQQMRVSSLIHERSFKSIVDLPEFEPKTYAKLQKRIKGIALAQETGKASKLFACRKLPKNFTSWIAYRDFLMKTHSDRERVSIFEKRFARHLNNEHVARQQCRQLLLNDYENNLPIDNSPDPREQLVRYYDEVL
jgi:predicted phosphoadenosine phosphosulfate sulfurtransferase